MTEPKIIVDADACPRYCLDVLQNEKQARGFRLVTVASHAHNIKNDDHIVVGNEKEAADMVIVNEANSRDLVVTQDWGLAALILGKGGFAISPTGRVYTSDSIDFMLEERALKAKHRRAGGRTRGPSARSPKDNQRFAKALHQVLTNMGI